jgi:apolipoprotein N-acyltransferase
VQERKCAAFGARLGGPTNYSSSRPRIFIVGRFPVFIDPIALPESYYQVLMAVYLNDCFLALEKKRDWTSSTTMRAWIFIFYTTGSSVLWTNE